MGYDSVIQNSPINESTGYEREGDYMWSALGDEAGRLKILVWWVDDPWKSPRKTRMGRVPRPVILPWKGDAPIIPGKMVKKQQQTRGNDKNNKKAIPEHHGTEQHPVSATQKRGF